MSGILTGNVSPDVILLACDQFALLVERPLLREPTLFSLGDEGLVATRIGDSRTAFEMQNVIGNLGEECPIVADQQDRFVGAAKILLEPACRFQIQVIGWLVEEQDVSCTHELTGEAESSSFSSTQLIQRLCTGSLGVEAEPLKHRIYPRRKRITPLALESLQITIVLRQHLWRGSFTCSSECFRLAGESALQPEQLREFAGSGFPDSRRVSKVAMLLEYRVAKSRRSRDYSFCRLLGSGYQAKESRLTAAVSANDSPMFAPGNGEGDALKDLRCSELDTGIRDRDLRQERSTLEQAARQRSTVSTVWSPMWPMRNVALFIFP